MNYSSFNAKQALNTLEPSAPFLDDIPCLGDEGFVASNSGSSLLSLVATATGHKDDSSWAVDTPGDISVATPVELVNEGEVTQEAFQGGWNATPSHHDENAEAARSTLDFWRSSAATKSKASSRLRLAADAATWTSYQGKSVGPQSNPTQFTLDRILGHHGSASCTWCARSNNGILSIPKALKMVDVTELSPERKKGVIKEAQSLDRIKSKHVVAVDDAFFCPLGLGREVFCIVMEFINGVSLRQKLSNAHEGRLQQVDAVTTTKDILKALADCHACGVVHGNVSPENVLFCTTPTGQEYVSLVGFGMSTAVSGGSSSSMSPEDRQQRICTDWVYYLSPEQFMNGPVDVRADLWSVAVILYEMLSGHTPWDQLDIQGTSPAPRNKKKQLLSFGQLKRMVCDSSVVIPLVHKWKGMGPAHVSQAMVQFLEEQLQRDPHKRFSSAGDMAISLDSVPLRDAQDDFHVFFSYRVKSEQPLVEEVYLRLWRSSTTLSVGDQTLPETGIQHAHGLSTSWRIGKVQPLSVPSTHKRKTEQLTSGQLKVFLDKYCLRKGEDWEQGFVNGLIHSKVFIPFISAQSVEDMASCVQNQRVDNVVLEYLLALSLELSGTLKLVRPVALFDVGRGMDVFAYLSSVLGDIYTQGISEATWLRYTYWMDNIKKGPLRQHPSLKGVSPKHAFSHKPTFEYLFKLLLKFQGKIMSKEHHDAKDGTLTEHSKDDLVKDIVDVAHTYPERAAEQSKQYQRMVRRVRFASVILVLGAIVALGVSASNNWWQPLPFSCSDDSDCHALAQCVDSGCVCVQGYTGDGRESCADVDECLTNSGGCSAHAVCSNVPGSHNCSCQTGYAGDGWNACADVDECASSENNCHTRATCSNSLGSFQCACQDGFVGDGVLACDQLDECARNLHNCHSQARCTDTLGSFSCTCQAGFSGDGVTCMNINECQSLSSPCHVNATCSDTVGSFACSCNTGLTGDGLSCKRSLFGSTNGWGACIVTEKNNILCWRSSDTSGYGFYTIESAIPLLIPEETPVSITVGGGRSDLFACAAFSSGNVSCWGNNRHGRLGVGLTIYGIPAKAEPAPQVQLGDNFRAVSVHAGSAFVCALSVARSMKCWGDPGPWLGIGMRESDQPFGHDPGRLGNRLPEVVFPDNFRPWIVSANGERVVVLGEDHSIVMFGKSNQPYSLGVATHPLSIGDLTIHMGNNLSRVDLGSYKPVQVDLANYAMHMLDAAGIHRCIGENFYCGIFGFDYALPGSSLTGMRLEIGRTVKRLWTAAYEGVCVLDSENQLRCTSSWGTSAEANWIAVRSPRHPNDCTNWGRTWPIDDHTGRRVGVYGYLGADLGSQFELRSVILMGTNAALFIGNNNIIKFVGSKVWAYPYASDDSGFCLPQTVGENTTVIPMQY